MTVSVVRSCKRTCVNRSQHRSGIRRCQEYDLVTSNANSCPVSQVTCCYLQTLFLQSRCTSTTPPSTCVVSCRSFFKQLFINANCYCSAYVPNRLTPDQSKLVVQLVIVVFFLLPFLSSHLISLYNQKDPTAATMSRNERTTTTLVAFRVVTPGGLRGLSGGAQVKRRGRIFLTTFFLLISAIFNSRT
jgi:hypothetical protein